MTLLVSGLLAGFLDGAAALLLFIARGNKQPALLFQYIASAVFGKAAFAPGARMVCVGILFHLLIALAWVALYYGLCSRISWPLLHPLAAAVVYGLIVWVIMNLAVVRVSRAAPRPFSWTMALVNIVILMAAIGLPAAYGARSWFLR